MVAKSAGPDTLHLPEPCSWGLKGQVLFVSFFKFNNLKATDRHALGSSGKELAANGGALGSSFSKSCLEHQSHS